MLVNIVDNVCEFIVCVLAAIVLVVCGYVSIVCVLLLFVFFQAEDGIRDLVRSRGLGDVYKRQLSIC